MASLPLQLCSESAIGSQGVMAIAAGMTALSLMVFLGYLRHAMKEVLRINASAFNFVSMRYSLFQPIARPDGRQINTSALMWAGGVGGIILAALPWGKWIGVSLALHSTGLALVFWFISYFFIGYLALGQFYLAWLLLSHSRRVGKTMLVTELAGSNTH